MGMSQLPLNYPVESSLDPCAICLGKCENKSFPKSCLHGFCFTCLLRWSEVKPECPLCLKPFSSVIHNIKYNHDHEEFSINLLEHEEVPSSEFSESDSENSSWRNTSSDTSWYTISSTSSSEHPLSELLNSYSEQHVLEEAVRLWTEPWRESSSDESSSSNDESISDTTRSESSWVTVNTESDSEDNLSTLHDIFSQQLILSEQSLGNLDAMLLSIHSDLAASHNDSSLPLGLQPRPNRIVRVPLVIDESLNSSHPTDPSVLRGSLCEIVYRWLEDASPSDEDNVNIESEVHPPA